MTFQSYEGSCSGSLSWPLEAENFSYLHTSPLTVTWYIVMFNYYHFFTFVGLDAFLLIGLDV